MQFERGVVFIRELDSLRRAVHLPNGAHSPITLFGSCRFGDGLQLATVLFALEFHYNLL